MSNTVSREDGVAKVFDQWAADGRDQKLAEGHWHSVHTFLDTMDWSGQFSFLDVGCGNGWVVRRMAAYETCIRAVGIDKSTGMITRARAMTRRPAEEYHAASLEEWSAPPFNVVFSMESLYYSPSVPTAISKAYSLLVPGGTFVCGTDYYAENHDTARWADMVGVTMHMYAESEWLDMFEDAGFRTSTTHVTDPGGDARWKREAGTLFLTGTRPEK
jgi:SAM-dependent methyltransferase